MLFYEKNGLATNAYDENLTYDKNGNILSLKRNGDLDPQIQTIETDNLSYSYPGNSNQLSKVVDNSNNTSGFNDFNKTGDDYTYDLNGNMSTDKNKKITAITYNHLNLPTKITFATTGNIVYIYNAAGQKVQKIVNETGKSAVITDYLGGYQYENTILKFLPTTEGYVKNTSGALSYVFQYKDHLGNIRVSYAKNPVTNGLDIIEENNYYPFGLKHKGYNSVSFSASKYKFSGKEFQDELGLNFYDYGARNYDPALGRWMNIDPLAETSRRFSPFAYALNNPIYFIDPDGMQADDWVNTSQGLIYDSRVTDQASADALYKNSTYYAVGTSYTSSLGNEIVLGDYGFFTNNGEVNISPDAAEAAENATRDTSGEVMQSGLALAGATIISGAGNPASDAGAGVELAGAALTAITLKAAYEITQIMKKDPGPPAVQYSLRASVVGEYPVMTSGSSVPTGTMSLNAGDVWKYGETTNPTGRYSDGDLKSIGPGVQQFNEFEGTKTQAKIAEKSKIVNYYVQNGHLPPGNKIFR